MFRILFTLFRFLFVLFVLRIGVDLWRGLTGRRPAASRPGARHEDRPGGRAGAQGPVQGKPRETRRARARIDRDGAVDVPFVEVGAGEPGPAAAPRGAERGS
ncbi:MAG: hypothetical protein ACM3JJ_08585 [Hyphomicrobiales bacterium]